MKKLGTIILCIFMLWLIPTFITAIIVPAFHKGFPRPKDPPEEHTDQQYVKIIDDNGEAMESRLQIIESAREELIFSTYYLADDDAGRDIMAALLAASQRGVHVRILVDGVCAFTSGIGKSECFQALLSQKNVEAKIYNPVHLLWPFNENYRMHDKYLAADDHVYILGGRNTRNKSIGTYPVQVDADRDALVYCEGPDSSIAQLITYFNAVWERKECRNFRILKNSTQGVDPLNQRYANLKKDHPEVFKEKDFISLMTPVKNVNLYVNPVAAGNKAPQLWTDLLNLMGQGKDIEIQTPYIILSHTMHRQFSELTRGREIKIITNAPETGANALGCAELLNRKEHLLKTGFQLYEYAADRSAHVKSIVIDTDLSLVGSFNFDMRSAYLDTETMLLIESPEINQQLRETNAKYMLSSRSSHLGELDVPGAHFHIPEMGKMQKTMYAVLRALIVPLRHLL